MKPAQWLAVLILALMVGGITFVTVYLGNNRPNVEAAAPTPASLTFVSKRVPNDWEKVPTTEMEQSGHADFWFRNDSGQDIPVGLLSKGCTCTEVHLTIAPESWLPHLLDEAAGQVLHSAATLSPVGLDGVGSLAEAYARANGSTPLSEGEAKTSQLTTENTTMVPAGAFGWVRLTWLRKTPGPLRTNAELWMSQKSGAVNALLEVNVMITRPVEVDPEMKLGSFTLRDLEKEPKKWLLCWSLTRPSFHLKVEAGHDGRKAESDPIEVGAPIALTNKELQQIAARDKTTALLSVQSGYRIPVKVRNHAKDGTPIEWGHIRRYITLTSEEGIAPTEVKVTGEIQGDVKVGSGQEGSTINLGPFFSSRGTHGEIELQTDVSGLQLKLDPSRIPSYLQVKFPDKPEETAGGHRIWVLEVTVPPNKALGEFPRVQDPVYADSAIYVKTVEKPERIIRIPVAGTANAD